MLTLLLLSLLASAAAFSSTHEAWTDMCGIYPPRPVDTRFPPDPPLAPVLESSWPREIESTARPVVVTLLGKYFDDWIDLLVCKMSDGRRISAVVVNESAAECKLPFTGSSHARHILLGLETTSTPTYRTSEIAILVRAAADYRTAIPRHASTRGSGKILITGVNFPAKAARIEPVPICEFGDRGFSEVEFISDTEAWCAVPPTNSSGSVTLWIGSKLVPGNAREFSFTLIKRISTRSCENKMPNRCKCMIL